jgi:hypothetical protein
MTTHRMAAIVADPRFKDVAAKLAFKNLKGNDDLIERVCDWGKFQDSGEYLKWNSVTGVMVNQAMNRAVGAPLWRNFPHAGLCNFDSWTLTPQNACPDLNAHAAYCDGPCVGNFQAPALYGMVGQLTQGKYPGDWFAPFTSVLRSVNMVRGCVRSAATPVIPWVGGRSWVGDDRLHPNILWANTDYWQEMLFQAMLSGASNNVLFFNANQPSPDLFAKPQPDDEAMNAALAELEEQTRGHRLVKAIVTDLVPYTAPFIASVARTDDGRIIARVSFAKGVNAADLKIDGKTIHVVCPEGKTGTWVEVTAPATQPASR